MAARLGGIALAATILVFAAPGESQMTTESIPVAADSLTFADMADRAAAAPIGAVAELERASRIAPEQAIGIKPGHTRFLVEAQLRTLLRSPSTLPVDVTFLADLPNQPDGKPPRPRKKTLYLIFAAPVAAKPGTLQLSSPDAMIAHSPEREALARRIIGEALRSDAPPVVRGVGRAFHVPGVLPGESETRFFLAAADGAPLSMNVARTQNGPPSWSLSLGDVVGRGVAAPQRDTLLWYRLACGLPAELPANALAEAEPGQHEAIRADYSFIREQLGACTRSASR